MVHTACCLTVLCPISEAKYSFLPTCTDNKSINYSQWLDQSQALKYGTVMSLNKYLVLQLTFCTQDLLFWRCRPTTWLTLRSSFLPEKLTAVRLVKFVSFYKTRRFITAFKKAATNPYPQPDDPSPQTSYTIPSLSVLILSFLLRLGLPSGLFYQAFGPNGCMHFSWLVINVTSTSWFNNLAIFREECKLWCSSQEILLSPSSYYFLFQVQTPWNTLNLFLPSFEKQNNT